MQLSDAKWDELFEVAWYVRQRSYSPYSNFAVGAAVLLDNGHIFTGTNVENASYGLTICAERSAIFNAAAGGKLTRGGLLACAIAADMSQWSHDGAGQGEESPQPPAGKIAEDTPSVITPCGACRQVIGEFAHPDCLIASEDTSGTRRVWRFSELFPDGFAS